MNGRENIDFNDLTNKSNQIINRISSFSSPIGLSSFNIERSLQEIGETSKHLSDVTSSKAPYSTDTSVDNYPKAIKKYGLDPKLLSKNLSNIDTSSFTDIETYPTDIDGYLKIEFENMILNTINDIQKKTCKEFQSSYENSLVRDWNKDKKYIEEILGQKFIKTASASTGMMGTASRYGSNTSAADFATSKMMNRSVAPTNFGQSQFGRSSNIFNQSNRMQSMDLHNQQQQQYQVGGQDRTKLSNKMRKYAMVIEEFDTHRADVSRVNRFPIVHRLMQANLSETTVNHNVVNDVWNLVIRLTGEKDVVNVSDQNDLAVPQASVKPSGAELITRSIKFLEEQFNQVIKHRLPKISNISSPLDEMVAYISANIPTPPIDHPDEEYKGCSVWSIIYFLLRAGHYQVANDFIVKNSTAAGRYKDLLSNAIQMRCRNERIKKEIKDKLIIEYNRIKSESRDSFKMGVFNFFSNSESNSTKMLFSSIQDFIWWKLNFIKESATAIEINQNSLDTLQTEINNTLSKNNFEVFDVFQILLVTQQFENAIVYLHQTNPEDALHLAISLDYYKLLNIMSSSTFNYQASTSSLSNSRSNPTIAASENLISSSLEIYNPSTKSIHLVAMIRQYTKHFSSETDNKEALLYYLLIENENLKTHLISDLVVTSTNGFEFAKQLQYYTTFINKQQWIRIIEQSAIELENKNDYQGAIGFWLLIEEYARVLEIYNNRISVLLTGSSKEREQLFKFGIQLFNERQMQLKTTRTERTSYLAFEQLLQLCQFFDYFNQEKYQEALLEIEKLNILPLSEHDIDAKVDIYRFLSSHITKNFAAILQAYIDIITKQYQLVYNNSNINTNANNANNNYLYAGRLQTINDLQIRAQAITLFAGKIDFPMSGNILTRLMNFVISIQK
ncbi:hypothetical protein CYY_005625 [Polysphondylium violaceum]|uniref:Nuclear pore protein n=1 Tax=Polysphondylium violaceum TaxID=133409 RepID=A0A8J4PTY4_9MYCE|nr:hypothetical protein CYY_005625 [Polysphondylium violaceum]